MGDSLKSRTPHSVDSDPFGWTGCILNGHFMVDAVASEGGFGLVYRGRHLSLDVPIAIKCLKVSEHLGESERESFLERLVREAQLLHQLSCKTPYVVQSLHVDAAVSPSGIWTPYMVMEWISGETLADRLLARPQAMEVEEAIGLLSTVASALNIAHEENIAHLDLKPSNMIFASFRLEPKLKVLDFGVAKVFADTPRFTISNADAGAAVRYFTPQYAAPEQFSPDYGPVGPWTDVFALALLLVELASGRRVLEGDSVLHLYVAAIDESKRDRVLERVLGAGEHLRDVLRRALDVNPRLRYRSIGAFWSAIEEAQALDRQGPITAPAGPVVDGFPAQTSGVELEQPMLSGDAKAKRGRKLLGALAMAALGGAVFVGMNLGIKAEPPAVSQRHETETAPLQPSQPDGETSPLSPPIADEPREEASIPMTPKPTSSNANTKTLRSNPALGYSVHSVARVHPGTRARSVRPIDDLPELFNVQPQKAGEEAKARSAESPSPEAQKQIEAAKSKRPGITEGWGID